MVPRLLYAFTNLPVIPPRSFFRDLDALLTTLIWGGSRHRVALLTLYLPITHEGLGAPSFEAYFLAAQLQWLSHWTAERHIEETYSNTGRIPLTVLRRLLLPGTKPVRSHPLQVTIARECMMRIHRMSGDRPLYSPLLPLVGFPRQDKHFTSHFLRLWSDHDVTVIGSFFEEGQASYFCPDEGEL